tara:strand:- start:416 stop:1228 length:813 start_codon:yes stop_codon:yes gene_type:complete
MKEKSVNICDLKNYKTSFEKNKESSYALKYVELINDFLIYASENIHVQNKQYYLFVIKRGVETFSHVFIFLIMYTRNINLVMYHCRKAFFYYIEFIGQITDDNHTYLQLNSKDATLFVYKKTLFEIDSNIKKDYESNPLDKKMMRYLGLTMCIYKKYILFFLHKVKKKQNENEIIMQKLLQNNKKIFNNFFSKKGASEAKLKIILNLFETMAPKELELLNFIQILEIFCRKLEKREITEEQIKKKLYSKNIFLYIKLYTPLKFVNWLFAK